jgi:hypothetical protein
MAKRAPDFLAEGTMPVLNHIPDQEIATLWRWLHAVHASAVK